MSVRQSFWFHEVEEGIRPSSPEAPPGFPGSHGGEACCWRGVAYAFGGCRSTAVIGVVLLPGSVSVTAMDCEG